jgi:subfamily B ATP-binding cassette protein MsbA
VQNANKIILLDKGKLMEEGTHQELLSKDGKYKLLYDLQFQD